MRFSAILILTLTLLMSCSFVADLSAQPAATLEVAESIQVTDLDGTDTALPDADDSGSAEPYGIDECSSCWAHGWWGCSHSHLPCNWHSTRDMYQRIPYMAEPEDYYYFRPYNHIHIAQQQTEVQNYGLDPRNPYANDFFETVYLEVEAAIRKQAAAEAKPAAEEPKE